jgi:hypothetical protein
MKYTASTMQGPAHTKSVLNGCFMLREHHREGHEDEQRDASCMIFSCVSSEAGRDVMD